jgi:hypothetical protein
MSKFTPKGYPTGSVVQVISVGKDSTHLFLKCGQTIAPRYEMNGNRFYNVDIPFNNSDFSIYFDHGLRLVQLPERIQNWVNNKIVLMLDPSSINFQKIQQQLIEETKNG